MFLSSLISLVLLGILIRFHGKIKWYLRFNILEFGLLFGIIIFFNWYGARDFFQINWEICRKKKGENLNSRKINDKVKKYLTETQILLKFCIYLAALGIGYLIFVKLNQLYSGVFPIKYILFLNCFKIAYLTFFIFSIINILILYSEYDQFRIDWYKLLPLWKSFEKNPSSGVAEEILKQLPAKKYYLDDEEKNQIIKINSSTTFQSMMIRDDPQSIEIVYKLFNIVDRDLYRFLFEFLGEYLTINPENFLKGTKENFRKVEKFLSQILSPAKIKKNNGTDNLQEIISKINIRITSISSINNESLNEIREICLKKLEKILNKNLDGKKINGL